MNTSRFDLTFDWLESWAQNIFEKWEISIPRKEYDPIINLYKSALTSARKGERERAARLVDFIRGAAKTPERVDQSTLIAAAIRALPEEE